MVRGQAFATLLNADIKPCDMLAANPKLPRHIRGPLERRLSEAAKALNMPEDLK